MNDGISISELVGKYTPNDDLFQAVVGAEGKSLELAAQYPDGVPTGVTIMAANYGSQWVEELLGTMLVELLGAQRDLDASEVQRQEIVTMHMLRLLRAHAQSPSAASSASGSTATPP